MAVDLDDSEPALVKKNISSRSRHDQVERVSSLSGEGGTMSGVQGHHKDKRKRHNTGPGPEKSCS